MKKMAKLSIVLFLTLFTATIIFAKEAKKDVKILSQKEILNNFSKEIFDAKREADELDSQLKANSDQLNYFGLIKGMAQSIISNGQAILNISKIEINKTATVKNSNFMNQVKNFFVACYKQRNISLLNDLKTISGNYNIIEKYQKEFQASLGKDKIINMPLDKNCYDDPADPNRYFRDVSSPRTIDTIIIHNSFYFPQGDKNIKSISNNPLSIDGIMQVYNYYQVSPHYIIDSTGKIYKTVDEKYIAFHAGKSTMPQPDGRESVNKFSIGIELLGQENSSPTIKQLESLKWLIKDINTRYAIKHVLGHNDISTKKVDIEFKNEVNNLGTINEFIKTDPWNFPWHKLNLMIKDLEIQYTKKQ